MTSNVFVYSIFLCIYVGSISAGGFYINFPITKCDPSTETCIQIRKCPFFDELLNMSSKPRPKSLIATITRKQCALIDNIPHVCCAKPTPPTPPTPPPTRPPTPPPELDREVREDYLPIDDVFDDGVMRHKNFKLLRNDICGPIPTKSRITSGKKTALEEFPWMALLAYKDDVIDFRCGGSVINERYVLTAAHCLLNTTVMGVRLGEYNLYTVKDCDPEEDYCAPPTQDFFIESIIVHPDYDPETFNNDIALVRLATPARFNDSNVQPICLPTSDVDLTGKFTIVSGWGVTETGYKSPELLKASVPVLPLSNCKRFYKKFAPVTSDQICAGGYKGQDSCGGDSGGPMKYVGLVESTPRYIQYGIVSYGPKHCGAEGQPGIYTKVSRYVEWILDNLKPDED